MYAAISSVSKDCQDEIEDKDSFISSKALTQWITVGCPNPAHLVLVEACPYWYVWRGLRVLDGVLMLCDHTIIPEKFRGEVLETLHSAYQGVYSMILYVNI